VGAVEKEDLIQPETIQEGDFLIGYASDGFHANGWSLCRRILVEHRSEFSDEEIKAMLAPTRLYHDVTSVFKGAGPRAKAFAHITGGGLPENLERLFRGMGADLTIPFWENAPVQKLLAHTDPEDRFNAFNMGIGWVAIVGPENVDAACAAGPGGRVLGQVRSGDGVTVKVQS
ncbi:AIR synthase-related protein, partial [bacterium]|nr:AIR synthase-related protein [bacterium]